VPCRSDLFRKQYTRSDLSQRPVLATCRLLCLGLYVKWGLSYIQRQFHIASAFSVETIGVNKMLFVSTISLVWSLVKSRIHILTKIFTTLFYIMYILYTGSMAFSSCIMYKADANEENKNETIKMPLLLDWLHWKDNWRAIDMANFRSSYGVENKFALNRTRSTFRNFQITN